MLHRYMRYQEVGLKSRSSFVDDSLRPDGPRGGKGGGVCVPE